MSDGMDYWAIRKMLDREFDMQLSKREEEQARQRRNREVQEAIRKKLSSALDPQCKDILVSYMFRTGETRLTEIWKLCDVHPPDGRRWLRGKMKRSSSTAVRIETRLTL